MDIDVLADQALAEIVACDAIGVLVVDAGSRLVGYANLAAHELLGVDNLSGEQLDAAIVPTLGDGDISVVRVAGREVSARVAALTTASPGAVVVRIADVTERRRQEQKLQAFSRTSASIAFAEELTTGLDRMAADVQEATGMYACTFFLMKPSGDLRQVGASGRYATVPDYADRLRACRELGAPLLSEIAFDTRRPQVVVGWRRRTLADERFAPLHSISIDAEWDNIAVIPLVVRAAPVGVFNGFYLAEDQPSPEDLAFLMAIADQAAVAIDNARMLVELEQKAALDERHRLARELHDSVSQALFSMTLQSRALELLLEDRAPELGPLRRGAGELQELSRGALAEMRALIFHLRPDALHEEGLVAAIRRHAAGVAAREGVEIRVQTSTEHVVLTPAFELELFRVASEALANAVKHSEATAIAVEVDVTDGTLRLEVTDNGRGFEPELEHSGHLGLVSMRERLTEIGGDLRIISSPGTSTRVTAVVGLP